MVWLLIIQSLRRHCSAFKSESRHQLCTCNFRHPPEKWVITAVFLAIQEN